MAAPSIIDGGMGSVEDPSPASLQPSEDWEKVTSASDSSEEEGEQEAEEEEAEEEEAEEEEEEEVVTSLDGLADFIKTSLKPFVIETKYVLEKCQKSQEREIKSITKACARLQEVCQICDQKDRLVIAGSGNVGKSTIANAMLGEKFLPTDSACLTSRICEVDYDASSTPEPIPKVMVQGPEGSHLLHLFHPSPLLKPDVILVDLPGLDQEPEHVERLEKYMKCHSDSSVALLYVIDVKDKICNPDRDFFKKLMVSPWNRLSQTLGLVVNKCDMGGDQNGASSDEEAPDYPKFLADITEETCNYCTPTVMDLSMKDKKKYNHPTAVLQWQKVETYANDALAQLKRNRIIGILASLSMVVDVLRLPLGDDTLFRAEKDRLFEAVEKLQKVTENKKKRVKERADEIRQAFKEKQEGHFRAILLADLPHYNQAVEEKHLDEVDRAIDRAIVDHLRVMVANDLQISVQKSTVVAETVQEVIEIFPPVVHAAFTRRRRSVFLFHGAVDWVTGAVRAVVPLAFAGMISDGILLLAFPLTFLAGAAVALAATATTLAATATWDVTTDLNTVEPTKMIITKRLVNENYVRQRLTVIYEQVMKEYPPKCAEEEYASIVDQAESNWNEQKASFQCFESDVAVLRSLDQFKAECSELGKQFDSLKKQGMRMK